MTLRFALIGFALGSLLALSACAPHKFLSSFGPEYSSQEACGFVQNVYGERISWKGELPIRISIHESVPSEFYPSVEEALKAWEIAAGRPLFEVVAWGVRGPTQPRQDGQNIIYWMDEWEEGRDQEQGRTSVYWLGDQIREADIRINARDFQFYVSIPQRARDVHMGSLLIHELGHVLGLKHEDKSDSVMSTYLASNTVRSDLTPADLHSVRCEY